MTDNKRPSPPPPVDNRGHQPANVQKGHQPSALRPSGEGNVQGGHQPTTGQGGTGGPPNQGSGGSKK